jgi:hypothetical protein
MTACGLPVLQQSMYLSHDHIHEYEGVLKCFSQLVIMAKKWDGGSHTLASVAMSYCACGADLVLMLVLKRTC